MIHYENGIYLWQRTQICNIFYVKIQDPVQKQITCQKQALTLSNVMGKKSGKSYWTITIIIIIVKI